MFFSRMSLIASDWPVLLCSTMKKRIGRASNGSQSVARLTVNLNRSGQSKADSDILTTIFFSVFVE